MNKNFKSLIWILLSVLILVASIPAYYAHNSKKNADIKTEKLQQETEIRANKDEKNSEVGFDVRRRIQQDREKKLLLSWCQSKIKDVLKSPLSFDHDAGTTHYSVNAETQYHVVSFKFYARNGFNRDIYSEAICFFDKDGDLIDFNIYNLE